MRRLQNRSGKYHLSHYGNGTGRVQCYVDLHSLTGHTLTPNSNFRFPELELVNFLQPSPAQEDFELIAAQTVYPAGSQH
jgi:hypothetical protein